MTDFFHIGNRKLIPLKDVPKIVPYTRDYVARLARDGKIAAAQLNRQWYIDSESLKNFFENSQLEMQARGEYTRELRKQELDLHEWWSAFLETQRARRDSRTNRSLRKTIVVIFLGLFVGIIVSNIAPKARPEVLAGMINGGQLAALISSDDSGAVVDRWYDTGVVTVEEVSLDNPRGILITPEGAMKNPEAFFSDPVVIEDTSVTHGLIHSSSSSSSVPFVRIDAVEEVMVELAP